MKHKANDQNLIYTEGNQNGCKNKNLWPRGQNPVPVPGIDICTVMRWSGHPGIQA